MGRLCHAPHLEQPGAAGRVEGFLAFPQGHPSTRGLRPLLRMRGERSLRPLLGRSAERGLRPLLGRSAERGLRRRLGLRAVASHRDVRP
jgi:hypothetical protein